MITGLGSEEYYGSIVQLPSWNEEMYNRELLEWKLYYQPDTQL